MELHTAPPRLRQGIKLKVPKPWRPGSESGRFAGKAGGGAGGAAGFRGRGGGIFGGEVLRTLWFNPDGPIEMMTIFRQAFWWLYEPPLF